MNRRVIARASVLVLLSGVASRSARAQPLETFLEAAARGNTAVQTADAVYRQRRYEKGTAWTSLLPRLTGTAAYTWNQVPVVPTIPLGVGVPPEAIVVVPSNLREASVALNMPIIDLVRWQRIRAAGWREGEARSLADAQVISTAVSVTRTFHAVLAAEAIEVASARAIRSAEELVAVTRARKDAGSVTAADEARAVAELQRRTQSLAEATRTRAVQTESLAILSGLKTPVPDRPVHISLAPEEPLERWLAAVDTLPAVRAARAGAAATAADRDVAAAAFFPVIAATVEERLTNATGFPNRSGYFTAGVAAVLELDVSFVDAVRARTAAVDAAEAQVRAARDAAVQRIYDAWYEVEAQLAQVRAAAAAVDANEEAARILRDRYTTGVTSLLDVTQANRDLFLSEADLAAARAQLLSARVVLRLEAGLSPSAKGPP